ncbi:MAG: AMP-binding protein [Actinomycetota bacterium]|nr:AMP-binding protein [Actinomycetota bacterium]
MSETREVGEDRLDGGLHADRAASPAADVPTATRTAGKLRADTSAIPSHQRGLPRPWLDSYPPGVPLAYDYPRVPLTRFLDDAARDFPDLAATWFEKATISYSSFLEQVDRLASALSDLGVRPGTPVGLVLPNLPAASITLFASLRLAAIVVPIHPGASSEELHHLLEDSGSELVVCLASVLPRIEALRARLPRLRTIITTQVGDWLPASKSKLAAFRARQRRRGPSPRRPQSDLEVLGLTDLLRGAPPIAKQAPIGPDHTALIAYSKGTEGSSRRITLSHANLVANAFQARLWISDTQAGKERILLGLPPTDLHSLVVGLLNGVLSAATLLLLPRFDVEAALRVIAQQRPTLLPAVPAMYTALVEHPSAASADLSSLRAGLSNGPLSDTVVRHFQALSGGRLRQSYGPAGTSPLTHANPLYGRNGEGRIGLPVTDTLAAVVDAADPARLLPPGEVGRLAVSGPQVTAGDWSRSEDPGGSWGDGWFVTEDLAVVDEEGYFALSRSGPVRRRTTRPMRGEGRRFPPEHPSQDATEDLP